ncbi:MAG TPA: response regulator transcription factor [Pirellulales bacterium]|nr:response regulator transcription factor [Pirellulales bacterium]
MANLQNTATAAARILIVDDHPIVREGLAIQISTQPDLEICGEAVDITGALSVLETTHPNVAIIDISLKNCNGVDLIQRIKHRNPDVRILVWSMYPENIYAERALRAGAHGYLNKAQPTQHVLEAIRTVLSGKVYVSGEVANEILHAVVGDQVKSRSPIEQLSNRELQAFELMGQGLTTDAIANKMHVSRKTVDTYRSRIKEKLGTETIPELIQRAVRWVLERSSSTIS